jgi:hypothetical protein
MKKRERQSEQELGKIALSQRGKKACPRRKAWGLYHDDASAVQCADMSLAGVLRCERVPWR